MKKIIPTALIALTAITGMTPAGLCTATATTTVGWTDGTHNRSKGVRIGTATEQGIAIRLTPEKAQLLSGQSIAAVRAAFCSSRMTDVVLFITDDLEGEPLYSQTVSSTSTSWSEYTLDTPYTMTGDELYIGFTGTISTSYAPLSFDYTDGLSATSYVLTDGQWTDAYDLGYGSANLQLLLADDYSFTDASLRPVAVDGYYKAGDTIDVTVAQLFNFGSDTITDLDLTYQTGSDTEPQVIQLTDLAIASGALYDLTLPQLTFNDSGVYDTQLTITTVNTTADDEPTDNTTTTLIAVYPRDLSRRYLVENFTTQQCTNCPTGHTILENAVGQRDDVAVVAHHSGYYTDYFTMSEDVNLLVFNDASGGTFAPAFMVNRYRSDSQASTYAAPAFYSDADGITDRIETLAAKQPYYGVEISGNYDALTRLLSGTVDVTAYATPPNATVYLNLYIVQDSIVSIQTSGGDNYTHRHVFRGTIDTGDYGLPIAVAAGETYSYEFSYTVPESITSSYTSSLAKSFDVVIDNMSLVAFVADYNADDVNDCVVYNADEVTFNAITSADTDGLSRVTTHGSDAPTHIYSIDGRATTIGAPGIYIIRCGDTTRKVVVR